MPSKTAEAFTEGQRAGHQDRPAGQNPHELGSPEYSEWYRGWLGAVGAKLDRTVEAARRVA